jgi:PKD repeat protein
MRKIKKIFCFYLIFILCIMQLFTIFVHASSIELIPIQDSYINNNSPKDNYGLFDELRLTIPSPGYKIVYLKFNLSTIPSSAKIVSSELKLYLNQDLSKAASISAYYCSNNNWDELLINWLNAPSYQSIPIYTRSAIVFEGWYSWNVISAVKTALSTGNLTLILAENAGNSCYFFSKDIDNNEKRPKLSISYETSNVPPTANFSYTKSYPTTNDIIQFNDTSIDSDGNISSWLWDFNDGTSSTISNPKHRFNTTGTYNVSLEVTDNDGEKNLVTKTINVSQPSNSPNIPPIASFSFYPFTAEINDTIQFTDSSTDSDGFIYLYYWDFGDGNTSELKNPIKIFDKAGTYTVSLNVTDDNGATNTYTNYIIITGFDENKNPPIPMYIVIPLITILAFVLLSIALLYLREQKKTRDRLRQRLREEEQKREQEQLK